MKKLYRTHYLIIQRKILDLRYIVFIELHILESVKVNDIYHDVTFI